MKKISNKWLIAIGGTCLLLLLIWLLFRPTPVQVETGIVKRGAMMVTIDGEGKTRVRRRFTVAAPVSGKMARIKLAEGDAVPKDFVITVIDPAPPERPLPPSQGEGFLNTYGVKVYAPVGGKVLRIIEKDERMITAGTPIMEIGDPEDLEIIVDILSTEATQVKTGASMLIENWGGPDPLNARVHVVEPQAFTKVSALGVEEQRVNVIADLQDKNVKLGDNYRLITRIIAWQAEDVLKVPSSALFREGEKWRVFVVAGGKARVRNVRIGHQNASETEILEGLTTDEKVILHPSNQIAEGISVTAN